MNKEILDRLERLEELAGIKKEKHAEEWLKVGDEVYIEDITGRVDSFCYVMPDMRNKIVFKTKESAEKYYSIIDTINKIVDELGRPSWKDFKYNDAYLYVCEYDNRKDLIVTDCDDGFCRSTGIFPYCKRPYLDELLKEVTQEDLVWAFKKSMRLID